MAKTLASLKGAKATEAIVAASQDPALSEVIPACIATLGPLVVPTLVKSLAEGDTPVRLAMIRSLREVGPIGGDESVRGLARALGDNDAGVRAAAADALRALGRFEPLVASLKHEGFDNRFVLKALTEMGQDRELLQAYENLLESMERQVTHGSMFAVEKLKDANHLTAALRYLEEVSQYLPDDSEHMEPAIRLKREVKGLLQSRTSRR